MVQFVAVVCDIDIVMVFIVLKLTAMKSAVKQPNDEELLLRPDVMLTGLLLLLHGRLPLSHSFSSHVTSNTAEHMGRIPFLILNTTNSTSTFASIVEIDNVNVELQYGNQIDFDNPIFDV